MHVLYILIWYHNTYLQFISKHQNTIRICPWYEYQEQKAMVIVFWLQTCILVTNKFNTSLQNSREIFGNTSQYRLICRPIFLRKLDHVWKTQIQALIFEHFNMAITFQSIQGNDFCKTSIHIYSKKVLLCNSQVWG